MYPKEVEEVLDELDGVLESAVIGVPDADFGEAVVAVVVRRAGRGRSTERRAGRGPRRSWRRSRCPSGCASSTPLPRNAMGKVEKAKLRAAYAD